MLDKGQLELIKGLVDKNLGEPIEQFETPSSVIKDPVALVCVCVFVWKCTATHMRSTVYADSYMYIRSTYAST